MSWIDMLAVLLGYKKPQLVPVPKNNQQEKR